MSGEREIEVKVIGDDPERLKRKLMQMGAVREAREHQTNYRVDSTVHPVDSSSYLRIRTIEVNGTVVAREMTFKRRLPGQHARVNEELTVNIDDEHRAIALLKALGYDRVTVGTKERVRYVLGAFRIEFDEWDKSTLSYPYVEIEAPSEAALEELIGQLEIPRACLSTKSIAQLRAEDGH